MYGRQHGIALRNRDDVLDSILASYAAQPTLAKSIVLQGGGALHFIYGSPRYSDDLDFVYADELVDEAEVIRVLSGMPVSFRGIVSIPKIKFFSDGSGIRIKYNFGENLPQGKVELFRVYPFEKSETRGKYFPLIVESPSEIYTDKIVASLGRMYLRKSIKPSDIFDMHFLVDNFAARTSCARIAKKLSYYCFSDAFSKQNIEAVISYIEDSRNFVHFDCEIKKFLLPDVYANKKFNKDYFLRVGAYFREFL